MMPTDQPPGDLRAVRALLLLFGCVLALSACGGDSDEARGEASLVRCTGGRAAPLSSAVVERALRDHGFSVSPEVRSEFCNAEGVVQHLTNLHFTGPDENISLHDKVFEDEGQLECLIRRDILWGNEITRETSEKKERLFFANVECTLYPHPARAAQQSARLEQAMRSLELKTRSHGTTTTA